MKRKLMLLLAVLILPAPALWAGTDSGFEFRFDGGLVSPVSEGLHQLFISAYTFGGSVGYCFGGISLLLDTQYNDLDLSDSVAGDSFNTWEWALVEKARFGGITAIKPFLFLGEGLASSTFSFSGASLTRTDPLLEGGVGLDFHASEKVSLFLQTKAAFVLTSSQDTSPDKVSVYIPIQAGMDFIL